MEKLIDFKQYDTFERAQETAMQQGPWTYINPYDRRFGPDFFKQVPEKPGVYWMQDSRRSLLYVGKSINLRKSLSSYRYIQPQNGPKRLVQLMEDVRSLGWSSTETEQAATLLEKQLIVRHQPSFNKSLSSMDKFAYLGFKSHYPYIQMDLFTERQSDSFMQMYGIFRNRLACHKAVSSMNRLLWWVGHQGQFISLPKPLIKTLCPLGHKIEIQMDENSFSLLAGLIQDYWSGATSHIVQLFEDTLNAWSKNSPDMFFVNWIKQDIEYLKHYFTAGPARNKRIKDLCGSVGSFEADWIDQLVLLA